MRDVEKQCVMSARRDTGAKDTIPFADVAGRVPALLEQIQVRALRPRWTSGWRKGGPGTAWPPLAFHNCQAALHLFILLMQSPPHHACVFLQSS